LSRIAGLGGRFPAVSITGTQRVHARVSSGAEMKQSVRKPGELAKMRRSKFYFQRLLGCNRTPLTLRSAAMRGGLVGDLPDPADLDQIMPLTHHVRSLRLIDYSKLFAQFRTLS
jgi:hypothetical protein